MAKILVIDDDIDICNLLQRFLQKKGHEVETAMSGKNGLARLNEHSFDLVFCDYKLQDMDGKMVLSRIKELMPSLKVVIITGYSDITTAVDIMKRGAFDYVLKPLIPDELLSLIQKALQTEGADHRPAGRNEHAPQNGKNAPRKMVTQADEFITGSCPESREMYKQIGLVAPTNFSVIIYGESGSGKENIARMIHNSSQRKKNPFIAIDCGALTRELAGSELWGHEKGAFTGAVAAKPGQFELANGGTIFLDEIANLSYDIQVGLLRLVQERKLRRIGGTKDIEIDVRIIVASNENLQEAVRNGRFREDLYFRFNEFSILVPALRERNGDIAEFADHFLAMANNELGKNIQGFSEEVHDLFRKYQWPGNLREMRNIIRRAALLTDGDKISLAALPQEVVYFQKFSFANNGEEKNGTAGQGIDAMEKVPDSLKDAAAMAEADVLKKVLQEVKYNRTQAARKLGIDRKTLFNKMKQYNL